MTSGTSDLPIEALHADFEATLGQHDRAVVAAPTGSGKSTRIPLWCAQMGLRTLVIEPRRLACRSLARFVARQGGKPAGEEVGYAVRHEKVFGPSTQVVYATPGTALRMLQDSPPGQRLQGWGALVMDEFHERQMDSDLLLAFALRAGFAPRKLVVMSATLQTQRLSRHMDAALLEGQGRLFPVTVEHQDAPSAPSDRDLEPRVVEAVQLALRRQGDILVFLPGKGEIAGCGQALKGLARERGLEVLPLHGDLKPEAQDKVFSPQGQRRIILSTNVAETSVTVPGVGVVIDAGLVRQTRYHNGRGVLRLVPIALDAAEQRRGRAGRLGPGHCIRLWSQAAALEPVTRPEVLREALTDLTLRVASCGEDPQALPWLDPPPEYALRSAREHLRRMGCLDEAGQITPTGQSVARLPLEVSQARVLEAAQALVRRERAPEALLHDVVDLTAALSPGRRLLEPVSGELPEMRQLWHKPGCDATAHILALRHGEAGRDRLHPWVLQEARRIARQLRGSLKLGPPPGEHKVDRRWLARAWMEADPHCAFARRPRGDHFAGHGIEVEVARESLLKEDCEALIAADVYTTRDRKGRVHKLVTCAIPMKLSTLEEAGLGEDELCSVRARGKRLVATIARSLGGRAIQEREEVPRGPLASQALLQALVQGSVFRRQVEQTRQRAARWNLYRRLKNLNEPAVDAEQWLKEQVEALGFEDGRDLELLLAEDFLWPWPAALYEAEREWLERNYPLEFQWHTTTYDVSYQVAQRTVTLEPRGRGKSPLPPLTFLPSWPGWRIQHKRASNVTVLRR